MSFFRRMIDMLTAIIKFVYQALDKGGKAQAVALDLSKSYDGF